MPDPVLQATDVAKAYRRGFRARNRVEVLEKASLELLAGEMVAVVGENGAGKSTFIRLLVGLDEVDGGAIVRSGRIGYCPQIPTLYSKLTPVEHFHLFGRVAGMADDLIRERGEALMESLSYANWRNVTSDQLSGGTRSKLNLSLALLTDPDVLLLDEPYSGFDWDTYVRFWDLARGRADAGKAVLVVTHIVMEAERDRFDRCLRMSNGSLEEVA